MTKYNLLEDMARQAVYGALSGESGSSFPLYKTRMDYISRMRESAKLFKGHPAIITTLARTGSFLTKVIAGILEIKNDFVCFHDHLYIDWEDWIASCSHPEHWVIEDKSYTDSIKRGIGLWTGNYYAENIHACGEVIGIEGLDCTAGYWNNFLQRGISLLEATEKKKDFIIIISTGYDSKGKKHRGLHKSNVSKEEEENTRIWISDLKKILPR